MSEIGTETDEVLELAELARQYEQGDLPGLSVIAILHMVPLVKPG